jgi:hypothetical protein
MNLNIGQRDRAEDILHRVDEETTERTGLSFLHIFTIVSILASVALFLSGRKLESIFVGLWPPTIQALKSVTDKRMF